MKQTQIPQRYLTVIDKQIEVYNKGTTIQEVHKIPDTKNIPIEDPNCWLKVKDVICVFADMKNSTKLSATSQDKLLASAYQLFTGTAIRLFDEFDAPYIDVKGDGVFVLFNYDQAYRAIAAAVTFKTFVDEEFTERIESNTGESLGVHIGIDQRTTLVRKIGLKKRDERTDRQNEVWAGKTVNMAAKLASRALVDTIIVSDRYYKNIDNDLVRLSCGCNSNGVSGTKVNLWEEIDVSDDSHFDFGKAYILRSKWCSIHGCDYLEKILRLD